MDSLLLSFSGYWSALELDTNIVVFFNIAGAWLLGVLVGYERSYRGRAAGMRTYGLVCMASCALTVIGGYASHWYGGHTTLALVDPGRVIQGIVTGIGFLGAGVIMRDGMNISGLTTAASIWCVAAIGVLVGVGFYVAAIMSAVLAGMFMAWGNKIEVLLPSRQAIYVHLSFRKAFVPEGSVVRKMVHDLGYEIAEGSFNISMLNERQEWRCVAVSLGRTKGVNLIRFSSSLAQAPGVESYHITRARN